VSANVCPFNIFGDSAVRILPRVLPVFVLLAFVSVASADVTNFVSTINSAQEVPINASTAIGSATASYDSDTNLLIWNIEYSGFSSPPTAMHFHGPATPGVNAGVQVNIGTESGLTSPSAGSTTITGGQATDLLAGLWYINIHTANFPGGEIRGQVLVAPVPEPGSAFIMSSLLSLALISRRRR